MILLHYSKKIGKSASGLPKIKIPGFATLKPFILDPKFSCSKREGKPTTSEKFKRYYVSEIVLLYLMV
jgi:hypothetical protein